MASFVKHTNCPQCGSRDNLGIYSDGSCWCFGCHYHRSGSFLDKIQEDGHSNTIAIHRPLPDDCGSHFSPSAVSWLTQYGLGMEEYIKRNVLFSPRRNQIIFTWPGINLWQARNLDREYVDKDGNTKKLSKYFTSGDHTNICPIYFNSCDVSASSLVLVEDAVSAIKLAASSTPAANTSARGLEDHAIDAMPLLGTHLPIKKINSLKGYKRVVVWLDPDKGKEAVKLANHLSLAGFEAKVVFTEKDPKETSYESIRILCFN